MFKKKMVFLVLILVLEATLNGANAIKYSRQYCINDTYAYFEDALYNAETGDLNWYNETSICDYGCFNGQCVPIAGSTYEIGVIIGIMLVAFFFLMTALKIDKETHGVIQVLLFLVSILFVIMDLSIISEIADYSGINTVEAAADSAYGLSIYVFWIVLFWFVILWLYKMLVMIGKIKPLKWSL